MIQYFVRNKESLTNCKGERGDNRNLRRAYNGCLAKYKSAYKGDNVFRIKSKQVLERVSTQMCENYYYYNIPNEFKCKL